MLGKFLRDKDLLDSIFVAIAHAEPRRIKTGQQHDADGSEQATQISDLLRVPQPVALCSRP
ncbi:hypothetical protein X747_29325 [Mesorhizobium sp. LNJC384A00]|nr:hypothetical protein X766_08390 [Mesorhizobium sp. LSJC255A00]ESX27608.1 hypothetical protein X765_20420 [Mesorhizobium sp. LSHC440B00]ESX30108.1 hypothetical protein X763_29760 [Mesorhizobium sp. LSHC432A00]ESX78414.1 hypothetical protein X757_07605 [Mesorhizobium sp. LSHC414A00]ESY24733.1 hypothetical protein X749_26785 [Mesorhizobium sp. LNJC391B00]ESY34733.1 hypothetical protein X747_29325 [Mesorhizobium sp. LNJC384A00]